MKTIAKSSKQKNEITRRNFLKVAGMTGVGVALLAAASSMTVKPSKAATITDTPGQLKKGKITPADRLAAAASRKGKNFLAPALVAPPAGGTQGTWLVPDYFGVTPNWANSPILPKFVAPLPIPTIADAALTPPDAAWGVCDYYVIALVEYTMQMHPGLSACKVRGYQQCDATGTPVGSPSYLGPIIVAQRNKPVRIKFINKLNNTGAGGDLFIPVDTTYMGAGVGPDGVQKYTTNRATLHLHGGTTPWISDGTPHQWTTPAAETTTTLTKGVSARDVPDMPATAAGEMTFYYTNQQSARLMFYHDHAYGITRLNVYVGEAAGYLVTDAFEADLLAGLNGSLGNPGLVTLPGGATALGTPLIIQDKTWVDPANIATQDPTWNNGVFPTTNDLWFPHVYMPNQNPYDATGANPMGRWDYGPWFWPPFSGILIGPATNPYYQPNALLPNYEPSPVIPGTPNPSGVPESFMDTPIVNGMAYPTLSVEPKAYRFRILNACNDRYLNLQLYTAGVGIVGSLTTTPGSGYTATPVVTVANAAGDTTGHGFSVSATVDLTPGSLTLGQVSFSIVSVGNGYTLPPVISVTPAAGDITGAGATATAVLYNYPAAPATNSEVGMVPANPGSWPVGWPTPDGRAGGFPDPTTMGPNMIQIGTEGGFLPAPAVIPNRPVGYDYNRRSITVLNVLEKALYLGPAERADVLIDFTAFAGKTIILYNDAPAPMPAFDPRLDYFTNDGDQTSTGGAPNTAPGFGPNTRTIMQINVGTTALTPSPMPTLAALSTSLAATFRLSQDTIIVPQTAYNAVYGTTVAATDATQWVPIQNTSITLTPIGQTLPVTLPLLPKAIQELFTVDYGRMNATLGVELPFTNMINQTTIPYGYVDPPTELIAYSDTAIPIGAAGDGTQIWKITHNGVDTHAIHVHMFNAQLINRVGWDGAIKPPEPNELGWKETIQMNPLEDIIIGVRAIKLVGLPDNFQPNSVRLLDPTRPVGPITTVFTPFFNVDPLGNPVTIQNQPVNYGCEYVWHCHLLGHEENDMMRPLAFALPPAAPAGLTAVKSGNNALLTWTNGSTLRTTNILVQRATDIGFTTNLTEWTLGVVSTFTDTTISNRGVYFYRVAAQNAVGPGTNITGGVASGYSQLTLNSAFSNLVGYPPGTPTSPPAARTNVTVTAAIRNTSSDRATISWTNPAGVAASSILVQMATNTGFTSGLIQTTVTGTATSATLTVNRGTNYYTRVQAINAAGTTTTNATPFPVLTP